MTSVTFCILAFHRSGTSLIAKWMDSMGLFMGKEQLHANVGNRFGHFEDVEILNLHEFFLSERKIEALSIKKQDIPIKLNLLDIELLKEIVRSRNQKHCQWGWKEPRTALFIESWQEVAPNMRSLILFREYEQCVDSLLRRFIKSQEKRRNFILGKYYLNRFSNQKNLSNLANIFLESWIVYNRCILEFVKKNKEKYIIVYVNDLVDNLEANGSILYQQMIEKFSLNINYVSLYEIFSQEDFQQNKTFDLCLDKKLVDNANDITAQFRTLNL